MRIRQKPLQSGDGHAARGWHWFGHGDQAVRYTDVGEHETFAEEQVRWERSDPDYARICEEVRQAKDGGEEASRRADGAKAEWDARVATQRHVNDDAQRAHHVIGAHETHPHRLTTSAIESNDSPAPGIMPEPVCVHRGRNPVSDEPTKLEVG